MSLSQAEISELSRLAEQVLAVPAAAREAWLQRLPAAAQRLVPRLRRALAADADGAALATLQQLHDERPTPSTARWSALIA